MRKFLQRSYPRFTRLATISFISRLNWLTLRMTVKWIIRDNMIFFHLSDQPNHTEELMRLTEGTTFYYALFSVDIFWWYFLLHFYLNYYAALLGLKKKIYVKIYLFCVCVTRERFKFSFPNFAPQQISLITLTYTAQAGSEF